MSKSPCTICLCPRCATPRCNCKVCDAYGHVSRPDDCADYEPTAPKEGE